VGRDTKLLGRWTEMQERLLRPIAFPAGFTLGSSIAKLQTQTRAQSIA
jgi:Cft2 family RNA processing exonuclease